ncbi:MAG: metal ABC transporter permease [Planctomycetes bacterium]|nr:metal ABC transporter permease [Planctomycetota bacterium]
MPHSLDYLWWPLAACLVLTGIHSYLGHHVLARKVIFVDLALAQIAALGATFAFLLGFHPESPQAYVFSLSFTFLGAAVFAATRMRHERIPQEAAIGIAYAVATAAVILLVDAADDPHGAEHIKDLLAGNILWVRPADVLKTAALYAAVGAFHLAFRRRFLAISLDPVAAEASGVHVPLWDFLFYLSFGLVITSSVAMAGVLLVFAYLIVPPAIASLLATGLRARLALGWTVGTVVSFVGLLGSYDRPSGPTIVCLFGAVLVLVALAHYVAHSERPARALFRVVAGAGGSAVLVIIAYALSVGVFGHEGHEHQGPAPGSPVPERDRHAEAAHALREGPPAARLEGVRVLAEPGHPEHLEALCEALEDPSAEVRLAAAEGLGRLGDRRAAPHLFRRFDREPHWDLRLALARALAALGHREARALLERVANEAPEPFTREEAQELLGEGRR